ncbi:MAG: DUF2867 domain-containing protein [Agriterribacter sp.]
MNKITIRKTQFPRESILNNERKKYHYTDSYQSGFVSSQNNIGPTDIGKAFFSGGPKWVEHLFSVRNKIVKLFGLKTPGNNVIEQKDNFKCDAGEQLGLFKVFNKTHNEVVIGEDDKHLNFRVSLLLDRSPNATGKMSLTITTTVQFNNWLGRVYFFPVKLFHKLIVPSILKRMIQKLEKRTS